MDPAKPQRRHVDRATVRRAYGWYVEVGLLKVVFEKRRGRDNELSAEREMKEEHLIHVNN